MKRFLFSGKQKGRLVFSEVKKPTAGCHQLLIKINAAAVNPHDWQYYNFMKKLCVFSAPSFSLGHDISGTVEAVGSKVKNFVVGDEVYTMSAKTGAFGEYQSVNQYMVAPKPKLLNHIQAASIPMASLTAWQIFILCGLKTGDTLLLNGASGGVGVYALQIAKARGVRVTAVCSGKNIEMVKELGADFCIDYTQQNLADMDEKYDVVFDTVGSLNPLNCENMLNEKGYFVTTILDWRTFLALFLSRLPLKQYLGLRHLRKTSTLLAMPIGKHLRQIGELVDKGQLKTVIDKTYPLTELEDAFEYSQTGRAKGKLVLLVDD